MTEFDELKEKQPFNKISDNFFASESFDSETSEMSVERLNDIFYAGYISPQEHSFLLRKLYAVEKKISVYAWLCLSCALVSWISFLEFSFGETDYTLTSSDNKTRLVSVFAPLAIIFFCLTYREVKSKYNVKGLEIALVGVSVAVAQLTIIIPVWLMLLYAKLFY
jgi:hypothetical protein